MLGPNVRVLVYKAQNARLILRNTTNTTKTARVRTMQEEGQSKSGGGREGNMIGDGIRIISVPNCTTMTRPLGASTNMRTSVHIQILRK
jgi:hypothetical protein